MPSGDFAKQAIKEISALLTAEPVETPRLLLRPFGTATWRICTNTWHKRNSSAWPVIPRAIPWTTQGCGWNISCVQSIPRRILPSF